MTSDRRATHLRVAVKAVITRDGGLLVVEYEDEKGPWYTSQAGGSNLGRRYRKH
jgi:hypothetical protein